MPQPAPAAALVTCGSCGMSVKLRSRSPASPTAIPAEVVAVMASPAKTADRIATESG